MSVTGWSVEPGPERYSTGDGHTTGSFSRLAVGTTATSVNRFTFCEAGIIVVNVP